MTIIAYRFDANSDAFNQELDKLCEPGTTITAVGGFFNPVIAVDITSTNPEDTESGGSVDTALGRFGFTRLSGVELKLQDPVTHWGSFDVSDAPTANVVAGDLGYCTNGDAGTETQAYYNGTNWVVFGGANHDTIISAV